ncbi:MAG: sulfate transporter family protein [Ahrensia sp.]|nr:sulfate transporter family protein [Ahrensia sp.]
MIVSAISKSVSQLFSKPFRSVFWKSIGLTIALLIGLWFVLEAAASAFLLPFLAPYPWVATAISWLLGAGLVIGMGFLVAPAASIFAGVFLDDIGEAVEAAHYAQDPPGRPLPLARSIAISLKFFGLVLVGNLVAVVLVLFFGLGAIIFFVLNGYLLGREYFQFAALRHIEEARAQALRRKHEGTIFLGGLAIAALLAVPFVNLLTSLFAGALMVHLFKALNAAEA